MKPQAIEELTDTVLGDYLGYHLRRASILDLNSFAREFGDEVKPVPFTVLCLIEESPGISASEICRITGLQRANIAPMLAEFDSRGLIERRADRDHRVQQLHLSPGGTEMLAGWRARVVTNEQRTFRKLTETERATLRRLLLKIWNQD